MLVSFPEFKKLEITDRAVIEGFTKQYVPYSDYNFTSLWSWDVRGDVRLSELNGNLVVRFTDYLSGDPFYSFLGMHEQEATLTSLGEFSQREGTGLMFKLLPEESIQGLSPDHQSRVTADVDNFDYVLSVASLLTYTGNHLRGKRNFVNRFKQHYQAVTTELTLTSDAVQRQLTELFGLWATQKGLTSTDIDNELAAMTRLFYAAQRAPYVVIGIMVDGNLAGFSICEIIDADYAILHFEKGDTSTYVGIYPFLMQETARALAARGCRYINYEQDLGLSGLRQCKSSFHPYKLLKKYAVTLTT